MTWRWASAAALALLLGVPLGAQQVREVGLAAVLLASDPVVGVAGPYLGLRTSARTRLGLTGGAGVTDGAFAWRGELAAHFLLAPGNRTGPGLYGGGGVAVSGARGAVHGWVMLLLGLEARPGASSGWFVEAGLGGGPRVSAGWRWRHRRR